MNVLLTNDDGYNAPGIKAMKKALEVAGHNVYVIAPSSNRSAVSHHINMSQPLEYKKVGEKEWSCSGFPVDCVVTGIRSDFLPVKPDCIISGINTGANLGTDIVYSGTCAAARQGSMYGVPSIAVSLEHDVGYKAKAEDFSFDYIAEFVANNVEKLASLCDTSFPYTFTNINAYSGDKVTGVELVDEIAQRTYNDYVQISGDKEATATSQFFPAGSCTSGGEKSDYTITKRRMVSVSTVFCEAQCKPVTKKVDFVL